METDDEEETIPPRKPFWRCQECLHEDHNKAMPKDQKKFYSSVALKGSPVCPKCKSIGFMPVGF